MQAKLVVALSAIIAALAFSGITWLIWPDADMVAPEKTGEIGFMGIVVVAKYVGYAARVIVALAVGLTSFVMIVFLGIVIAKALSKRPVYSDLGIDSKVTRYNG